MMEYRNLPNFLCIGSQKAGTSWAYEMLSQHPDIWLPNIKEVHYFDFLFGEQTGTRKWGGGHVKSAMDRMRKQAKDRYEKKYVTAIEEKESLTEEWYASIFDHREAKKSKIVGEVTPEYCSISAGGIRHVKSFLGDPKILWIIRDPYERAISQVKMVINRGWSTPPRNDSEWKNAVSSVRYQNRANYKKYIPLWDEAFGDKIKYLAYGDIKTRPSELLEEIEDFLEVKKAKYSGAGEVVHKTKKLELPGWVEKEIKDNVKDQYGFLESRFGENFVKATS